MKTDIIKFKGNAKDKVYLKKISDTLKSGGLVVLPTETVYGLGGNGLNKRACKKIYEAKGRPSDNPLILHIAENSQLDALVAEIPDVAKKCMEKFWPGPLTIIFKRSEIIPDEATGGLDTVAIREPSNEIAHAILKAVDFPVAAPSANLSGRPSPTKVEHVIEDLREIDENIRIDSATIDAKSGEIPKSPGQKYRHYAPRAEAICFGGRLDKVVNEIKKNIKENKDKKIAVLATDETFEEYKNLDIKLLINLGSRDHLEEVATNLFDALRRCDEENVDIIFAEGFELRGMGLSIMNRLLKACSGKVVMRI